MRHSLAEVVKSDQGEQLHETPGAILTARQPERHVAGNVQVREEGEVLEDHHHATALGRNKRPRRGQHLAVDGDRPGVRLVEASDQPQQRRFPAAAGPEERDEAPLRDIEVGVVDSDHVAEATRDAADRDEVRRGEP